VKAFHPGELRAVDAQHDRAQGRRRSRGRALCERLKGADPRQLSQIAIQAAIGESGRARDDRRAAQRSAGQVLRAATSAA